MQTLILELYAFQTDNLVGTLKKKNQDEKTSQSNCLASTVCLFKGITTFTLVIFKSFKKTFYDEWKYLPHQFFSEAEHFNQSMEHSMGIPTALAIFSEPLV